MKRIVAAIAFCSTFHGPTAASAANNCKDMQPSTCAASAACTYVKSYKTKAGATIKAYCRKASRKRRAKSELKNPVADAKPAPTTAKIATSSKLKKKPVKSKRQRSRRAISRKSSRRRR